MKKILLPALFMMSLFIHASAQPTVGPEDRIKTLTLNDTIVSVAIDRPGDFYAITNTGQIQRFDKDGKLTLLYKAERVPTLFDPRDGSRIFVYYRGDQLYEYRNPSFESVSSYKIDPAFAIQPWLICPSGDHKLWVLDSVDHSLKRIDVRASEVEVEVVVDSALIERASSFTLMREYQNFVFLLNPQRGIYIFNSLGRHIKTIPVSDVQTFNFLGEELYYLQGGKLQFMNLFSAETRQLPMDRDYHAALLTDERMILFTLKSIDIFSFRP